MIIQKTSIIGNFVIRTYTGEPGDILILKETLPDGDNMTIGVKETPDGRKQFSEDSDILVNCVHAILEGSPIFKNVEKSVGDGGWFYMPEDILSTPITCEVTSTLLMIDHIRKRFIDNRAVHSLDVADTLTISPSSDKQKYVYLATGSVTINSNIEIVFPKMLSIRNTAAIIASETSIILELEV